MTALLSTQDLARYIGVAEGTIRKWRWAGRGPVYTRLGGSRGPCRYRPEDVESWLREREAGSTSEESARAQVAAAGSEG